MSLSRNVPNFAVNQGLPFLLQVKFEDYAKLLAAISGISGETSGLEGGDESVETAASANERSSRAVLTRYVGFNGKLTELQTVLASASINSMWIRGAPGTGKT